MVEATRRETRKKRMIIALISIFAALILIWILVSALENMLIEKNANENNKPIAYNFYYADFEEAHRGNPMLGEVESFKVLNCDGQTAEVYYIESGKTGAHVLSFEKTDGCWAETGWRCIWSTTGSASEVIWPYWWHFIYGGL